MLNNILLIEDNIYKAIDIERALEECGVTNITRVGFLEEALERLEVSFDLIITDMQYPLQCGGDCDLEAGFKLIEYLKENELAIPVVICSTNNYESVPDVFARSIGILKHGVRLQVRKHSYN